GSDHAVGSQAHSVGSQAHNCGPDRTVPRRRPHQAPTPPPGPSQSGRFGESPLTGWTLPAVASWPYRKRKLDRTHSHELGAPMSTQTNDAEAPQAGGSNVVIVKQKRGWGGAILVVIGL